ncbi:MAG: hypothetical protein IKO44_00215 [Ruminococcus sp.]|nr:hypothetical protein [Ruminococcus sp.]
MAFPLKKKKEESTNEKIIRLHQEGKSVEEICAELEGLRNPIEIVTGVIQRKLGVDAVPDAVVTHEKNHAAEVIAAASGNDEAEPADSGETDTEGLTKLERYMLEKQKKKHAPAKNSKPEPEPEPVAEPEIAAPPVVEPVNVPEPVSVPEPEVHKVSLVDEYLKQNNLSASSAPSHNEYTPGPGEEYAEMDALVPPDVESGDISDIPILTYTPPTEETSEELPTLEDITADAEAKVEAVKETVEEPAKKAEPAPEAADKANKVADKMKAFALSQIDANNAKIAELEEKQKNVDKEFASKIEAANTALMNSQVNFDMTEAKLNEAYANIEKAREEHRLAIAKADDEYRRKLEEIEEQYRNATFEANNKFQEFDDKSKEEIEKLDSDKTAAQADLAAKRAAVSEIHTAVESESEKLKVQINALKEENAGYQSFLN